MLKRFFKSEHEKMIELAVKSLKKRENEDIKANVSGFETPQKVVRVSTKKSFLPDIAARKKGQFRLFAVETKKTLNDPTTIEKWSLFAEFAKQNEAQFFIVFPSGFTKEITDKLKVAKIEAHLWELLKEK